jgi:hypothetical protein
MREADLAKSHVKFDAAIDRYQTFMMTRGLDCQAIAKSIGLRSKADRFS